MTASTRRYRRAARRWALRAGGFLAGGAAGAFAAWRLLGWLSEVQSPLVPLAAGTAVSVTVLATSAWVVVLGESRSGPWWGGLVAAWVPAVVVAGLAVVATVTGDLAAGRTAVLTALLYLASAPLTAVLAVVGGLLEAVVPRSRDA